PDVEIVGEIEVPMPSVTVKQVLGAPITKAKLSGKRNLGAMRRYVLQRWVEIGRGDVLVVTQKDIEARCARPTCRRRSRSSTTTPSRGSTSTRRCGCWSP